MPEPVTLRILAQDFATGAIAMLIVLAASEWSAFWMEI